MARLSAKLRGVEGGRLAYWCQGCNSCHMVRVSGGEAAWTWDGNITEPTFAPSVLVTSGHYMASFKAGDKCWCTYAVEHPERPIYSKCIRCHTFIRGGMVEFLPDCTHAFAGKTEPLPDWPYAEGEYGGV